jgi:hypothetical protein
MLLPSAMAYGRRSIVPLGNIGGGQDEWSCEKFLSDFASNSTSITLKISIRGYLEFSN